jgi:steroid delta-isomerase-like uncharacterized protein
MSTEHARALVRRWYLEVFAQGRLDLVNELFTPDCLSHDVYSPPRGWPRGPEGARAAASTWRAAVPDLQFKIEDQVADGDRVVTRWTGWGTNRGALLGIPPTGRSFMVGGVSIERIAEGKIAESWVYFDMLGLLQQLGALPASEPVGL